MYERSSGEVEKILKSYEALALRWGVTVEHARQMGLKTLLVGPRQNNLKVEIIEANAKAPGGPKPTLK